jgi:hypothetical protein
MTAKTSIFSGASFGGTLLFLRQAFVPLSLPLY